MGFFDDFTKNASKAAGKAMQSAGTAMKSAVNKSSDFAEISKLKMKISAEQKAIDDLYYYIGRSIYDECEADGVAPASVQERCSQVYEHKSRMAELQGKIELIRGQSGSAEEGESEVSFGDGDEVLVEDLSPVASEPGMKESAPDTLEEDETQYGVLPDIEGERK